MKKLILLIILVVMLAGLPVLVVSDTGASLADSNTPSNEMTTGQNEVSNYSATATITITMTGTLDE